VAGQAVDVVPVAEVEGVVRVSDADVALGAAAFVGGYGDAEVVQDIVLAVELAFEALDVGGDTLPVPVTGHQHRITDFPVAGHARLASGVIVL